MAQALKHKGVLLHKAEPQVRLQKEFSRALLPPAQILKFPVCEKYEGKWVVCGSKGLPAKEIYIKDIEQAIQDYAGKNSGLACVVIRADKKSLNNINKAGGVEGAGDSSLKLYMDILDQSVRDAYPNAQKTYLVRDSDHSDETFIVVLGKKEDMRIPEGRFDLVYENSCRKFANRLGDYEYSLNKLLIGDGTVSVMPIELDLARFADALVEPMLVAQAHICGPKLIEDFSPGFLSKALVLLGKKEAVDFSLLPKEFQPEIEKSQISPFVFKREEKGFLENDAVALEIKFSHGSKKTAYAPFGLLEQTQKGLSEILSGRFGLRYINTYMGEAVADKILNHVGVAMQALVERYGVIINKSNSKLTFIVKGADPKELEKIAKLEIEKRLSDAGFSVHPVAIHAGNTHVNDLRAYLTLHNMNLHHLPSEAATYADLLVSVAKIIKPEVVSRVIKNGAHPVFNNEAGSVLSTIYELCSKNPAIRDAEDLVWFIRRGSAIEQGAEEGIWNFVLRWGKEFRNRLIDAVEKNKEKKLETGNRKLNDYQ